MIVDMHCHVLPGVDDGPKTMEDSMRLLAEAVRQGVNAMIVTPHFHPGRYKVYAEQNLETLNRVRYEAARQNLPIELIQGQECYYYSGLLEQLNAGKVLTMAGSRFVLVEFDPEVLYSVIRNGVRELISNGYLPIVAHYERYRCLQGHVERLEELRGDGAMLQMNFDRLLAKDGLFHRNPWRRLMLDGYVDFLGSDTHGMDFRPPHIDAAIAWIRREVPPRLAERILTDNIEMLFET